MSDDWLEEEYISGWTLSAKQHFDDGDYEWLCDTIQQCFPDGSCKRILELGCGAGYSTLVLLLRDYRVVSVDINAEAVKHTDALIKNHDYASIIKTTGDSDNGDTDALLWEIDIVHKLDQIKKWAELQGPQNKIDLIVLCNPGGKISEVFTQRELELLQWGEFANEEILECCKNGDIDLLHKWALIYASCALSQLTNIPLLIVERDIDVEFKNTLKRLESDVEMYMTNLTVRPIKDAPNGGTHLVDASGQTGQLYWGAALFTPISTQDMKC